MIEQTTPVDLPKVAPAKSNIVIASKQEEVIRTYTNRMLEVQVEFSLPQIYEALLHTYGDIAIGSLNLRLPRIRDDVKLQVLQDNGVHSLRVTFDVPK